MKPTTATVLAALAFAPLSFVVSSSAQTAGAPMSAGEAKPAPVRTIKEWNIDSDTKLAIAGYDPVAYFPEGGGEAKKGDAKFELDHMGVKYRFASQENLDKFKANPARYEPAHGGWCSWAMREGDKVDIDPASFIVKDDRLFLFYKGWLGNTRAKWLKGDHAGEAKEADTNWKKLAKEEPRMVPATMTGAAKETPVSLQSKLDGIWNGYTTKLPPDRIAGIEGGIKQVADAGVPAGALKVGAQAPEFELSDATGKKVALKSMLEQGPVVLTWYRGNWCPFCVAQLKDYQQNLAQFKAMGASVLALSPQTVERSRELVEKSGIGFSVLSDPQSNIARAYGLAYKVPGSMRSDLSAFNGTDNGELPLAATYVLDRSGKVVYAFASADFRKRAETQEILSALRSMESAPKAK